MAVTAEGARGRRCRLLVDDAVAVVVHAVADLEGPGVDVTVVVIAVDRTAGPAFGRKPVAVQIGAARGRQVAEPVLLREGHRGKSLACRGVERQETVDAAARRREEGSSALIVEGEAALRSEVLIGGVERDGDGGGH